MMQQTFTIQQAGDREIATQSGLRARDERTRTTANRLAALLLLGARRHEAYVVGLDVAMQDAVTRGGLVVAVAQRPGELDAVIKRAPEAPCPPLAPRHPKRLGVRIGGQLLVEHGAQPLEPEEGDIVLFEVAYGHGVQYIRVSHHRHEHDLALHALDRLGHVPLVRLEYL